MSIAFRDGANQLVSVSAANPLPTTSGGGAGLTNTELRAAAVPVISAGDTAAAAVDAGNPVKIGAVYMTATPTYTNTQRGNLQMDSRGSLKVVLIPQDGTTGPAISSTAADAVASSTVGLTSKGFSYCFDATNWNRTRGDVNGLVVQSGLSATFWNYASASGGISNTTTAVTLKAAAGASVRNYLKSLQLDAGTLGAATEIAIRDGAGGTVLWRGLIGTAGLAGRNIVFDPPLKGTANTLLEVVTLTATVTGSVYVNAQGFTGT